MQSEIRLENVRVSWSQSMMNYGSSLLLLVLAVVPAAAQEDYSGEDFEKFISTVLEKKFQKKPGKKDVYSIAGGFRVIFDEENQTLEFFEQYTYELPKNGNKVMSAKLAAWNKKASLSKASEVSFTLLERTGGGTLHVIRFKGIYDIKKMGQAKLKSYYDQLDLEFEDFVIYMQDLLKHDKKGKASSELRRLPDPLRRTDLLPGVSELSRRAVVEIRRDDTQ
jgi:hypothetical protein